MCTSSPTSAPRDLKGTLSAAPAIRRLLKAERFDAAVSTGAAIAASALPIAAWSGVPATYVESVCRLRGPSATGRILQRMPGVSLRTPHPVWAGGRWTACESILSDFRSAEIAYPERPAKLFVTLGTIQGYRFDSIVDALLASGYANDDTVWQLGDTTRTDALPGEVFSYLSPSEFSAAAREADVVVTHAGVGTLLELLSMGAYPVLAVRRASRKEHVDDHQTEIADLVNANDIGIAVEGPQLTAQVIEHAASRRIIDGFRTEVTAQQ
ncbi:glycosyltransferase [Microbacterium sp. 4R-513]|uniref:glycosyltransferase n=1 Tax=Microbacterium sp. 4R-513 TaxID=2567934 RepID=UPI0013E11BDB|nr:glycosyltransferase [Microbacterium sp. 4R-513]QIG38547.1 glycosyltransferase [Microbacterium sp. 4R-513]